MNLSNEMLLKAKEAKSAEELLELAKTENIELTMEDAQEFFEALNPAIGELSDEELKEVSGGRFSYEDIRAKYEKGLDGHKADGTCCKDKYKIGDIVYMKEEDYSQTRGCSGCGEYRHRVEAQYGVNAREIRCMNPRCNGKIYAGCSYLTYIM